MQWDNSGIAVYFFPRSSVPSDITAGSPNPDGWVTPMARWPAATCNPWQFFNSHSVIFDTTLWYVHLYHSSSYELRNKYLVVVTGPGPCGHQRAFLVKNRAAHNARGSPHAKHLFKPTGSRSPKHVSGPVNWVGANSNDTFA